MSFVLDFRLWLWLTPPRKASKIPLAFKTKGPRTTVRGETTEFSGLFFPKQNSLPPSCSCDKLYCPFGSVFPTVSVATGPSKALASKLNLGRKVKYALQLETERVGNKSFLSSFLQMSGAPTSILLSSRVGSVWKRNRRECPPQRDEQNKLQNISQNLY